MRMTLKRASALCALVAALFVAACAAVKTAETVAVELATGTPAPPFTAVDSNGKTHSLSDFKGKFVVLEWVNFDCPFVVRHYKSGNMQALQRKYTAKGVIWLSINSSAVGKQGYFTPAEINAKLKERNAAPTAYLIDTDGKIGKAYGAKTTPHMFVIDPQGNLIYQGAIDDSASTDVNEKAKINYVEAALDAAMAGKPVATPRTKPYGCSVKYAS
ncbi:MAG: thioredoxin family protein [Chloracidobacterium sp.]|nr:thioredoxin family protein [Chloracidobacterium sp.]MDW8217635.1 thioredoxin family protein [Acidobacteriota bacterium]